MKILILSNEDVDILKNALADMGGLVTDALVSNYAYHYYDTRCMLMRKTGKDLELLSHKIEKLETRLRR